jgi:hypothetical protein
VFAVSPRDARCGPCAAERTTPCRGRSSGRRGRGRPRRCQARASRCRRSRCSGRVESASRPRRAPRADTEPWCTYTSMPRLASRSASTSVRARLWQKTRLFRPAPRRAASCASSPTSSRWITRTSLRFGRARRIDDDALALRGPLEPTEDLCGVAHRRAQPDALHVVLASARDPLDRRSEDGRRGRSPRARAPHRPPPPGGRERAFLRQCAGRSA